MSLQNLKSSEKIPSGKSTVCASFPYHLVTDRSGAIDFTARMSREGSCEQTNADWI